MHSHHLPKVFIAGASGYIGFELAQAYRRAGHVVYGLVRSAEKGRELAANEIIPVVGDVCDAEGEWINVMKGCGIVINSILNVQDLGRTDQLAAQIINSAVSSVATPMHPVRLIHTSGILVFKAQTSPDDPPLTDDSPLDEESEFFQLRIKNEKDVLDIYNKTNGSVIGFVIRPGFVYGRRSQHYYTYFEQAVNGKVVIKGDPEMRNSTVHIDDLCAAYLLLSSHPYALIHSTAYNVVAPPPAHSVLDIAKSFAKAAGYNGSITTEPQDNPLYVKLTKLTIADSPNIRNRLGWTPKHPSIVEEADVLWTRWKAVNNLEL